MKQKEDLTLHQVSLRPYSVHPFIIIVVLFVVVIIVAVVVFCFTEEILTFPGPVIVPPVIRPAGPGNHLYPFSLPSCVCCLLVMFRVSSNISNTIACFKTIPSTEKRVGK